MSEFSTIDVFLDRLGGAGPSLGVEIGSGDDAAVFQGGTWPVVSVDTLVEGVHWDKRYSDWEDVGHKLLACNLSDMAAMGAVPGPFLLALSLPSANDSEVASRLAAGIAQARASHRLVADTVCPIGGDLTRSPGPAVLSLTVFGRPGPAQRLLLRSGARIGDGIWVSGSLGLSAGGLAILEAGCATDGFEEAVSRHRRPIAKLGLGSSLAKLSGVSAAIDVSDGIGGDLPHILRASGELGATIQIDALPIADETKRIADFLGLDAVELAIGGGEDFELLATATKDEDANLLALGLTRIGRVVEEPTITYYERGGELSNRLIVGYQHE